jgi:vacuolar protein sorting-associated protein 35
MIDSLTATLPPIQQQQQSLPPVQQPKPPIMDDTKVLADVLQTVKMHATSLRRHLDQDQIMESLKAASSMLAELRTSSLGPKQYYELYMAVFDSLRHLSGYLAEAHAEGKHHLADLYELVQ